MRINVFHHFPSSDDSTNKKLDLIISKLEKIMSVNDQILAFVSEINDATNQIAANLQALRDQIAAGTVSPEALALLDSNINTLQALAAEPPAPPAEG